MTLPVRRGWRVGRAPMWISGQELDTLSRLLMPLRTDTATETTTVGWNTPIDLEETEDAYVLEMDLPGVGKDALTVDVTGTEIRVSGEITEHEHHGFLHHHARTAGHFEHRVTLPGEVDPTKVEASLRDGVLTVRAPKAEADKPQKVAVTVN